MPYSVEISVPILSKFLSFEEQTYDDEVSNTNDEDLELENDSVRKGFNQHDLIDLVLDIQKYFKTTGIKTA